MKVKEFVKNMNMKVLTGEADMEMDLTGLYVCDLLSWVMSHIGKGNAWITVHTHLNIVAVALLAEASCIIIPEGITVEEATIKKAEDKGITILSTPMNAYEVCWKAHELIKL